MEFGEQRDDLARQMSSALNAAEFNRHPINEEQASNLIGSAQELLEEVRAAAA
jgi:predicted site-specific integrase-resolvase